MGKGGGRTYAGGAEGRVYEVNGDRVGSPKGLGLGVLDNLGGERLNLHDCDEGGSSMVVARLEERVSMSPIIGVRIIIKAANPTSEP